MAFFTRVNTSIPFLPSEQTANEEPANKDDKKQYSNECPEEGAKTEKNEAPDGKKEYTRYDYVVDRVLGVEV